MKKLIMFLVVISLIAGCAASKKTITEDAGQAEKKNLYDESFDPLSLNDDDIEVTKTKTSTSKPSPTEEDKTLFNIDKPLNAKEVDGFRVQVLASASIESSTFTQQKAADQFRTMNCTAYLIFEAPLYKVRVGDALNRQEAEEILNCAKDFGYNQAFIVRSKVIVKENQGFED
ncbi:MAG: SPOR domain-containing protein [Calditrichales bacterium]|nr:SPOR domain-containing protein [Calditrichales bacterium]